MQEKELSLKHKAFIDEYFTNGQNATQAYRAVYPKCSEKSANIQGSELLGKIKKNEYFIEKSEKKLKKTESSYEFAYNILKNIAENAEKERDRVAAINEMNRMEGNHKETKIKLMGFVDHDVTVKGSLDVRFQELKKNE